MSFGESGAQRRLVTGRGPTVSRGRLLHPGLGGGQQGPRRPSWTQGSGPCLSAVVPGGGVPCGPGVQERPGRLPSGAGKAVDILPEGTAQLLCARGLPLLLQCAAGRHRCRQPGGPARGPCSFLHPQQQVSLTD